MIFCSSLISEVASFNAPGTNAGLSSCANANERSGVRKNRSLPGSYVTYPPAAWLESHSRT